MSERVVILMVEDDDIDARVFEKSLREAGVNNEILRATDGVEALHWLKGEHGKQKITKPLLILLDQNMPRMNGTEFLSVIRTDPALAKLIVFMLTTSSAHYDQQAAYANNVSGYLVKSDDKQDRTSQAILLKQFLKNVHFPVQNDDELIFPGHPIDVEIAVPKPESRRPIPDSKTDESESLNRHITIE